MKRFLKFLFVLFCMLALLAGGFALRHFWDKINPYAEKKAEEELFKQWLVKLQQACNAEDPLKGTALRFPAPKEEKGLSLIPTALGEEEKQIALTGIVAKQEQIPLVEARARALLNGFPKLSEKYSAGITTTGLKVFPIHEQLARLQADFNAGKESSTEGRLVLRLTRLDRVDIRDDGKLVFDGICLRGDGHKDSSRKILRESIGKLLKGYKDVADALPDVLTEMQFHDPPAVALQKIFAQEERWRDVHLLSAWYERDGKLHLEGLVGKDEQRKPVENAVAAWLQTEAVKPIWRAPQTQAAKYDLKLITFDAEARIRSLQKELVKIAEKQNKPLWHQVRLMKLAPGIDRDAPATGQAPPFRFRVAANFLANSEGDAKRLQSELPGWLQEQLPKLLDADLSPVLPKLELTARANPVEALQAKIVERGLDGTVITAARYDAEGRLELQGRLAEAGEKAKQEFKEAAHEILAGHAPWTLDALKPHEARPEGEAIAWIDVLRACQGRLAKSVGVGQRTRLDRLYFRYENKQLRLDGAGAWLAETAAETPIALGAILDQVIATRQGAEVLPTLLKRLPHPMIGWQQKIAEQTALDGTLLAQLRYDADGVLRMEGFLGAPEQKESLRNLLAAQLALLPAALKSEPNKDMPAWSMTDFAAHQSLGGKDQTWSEILRGFQAELAASDESALRHMRLDRAMFQYGDKPRRLTLQWHATRLLGLTDLQKDPALKKIDDLGKKILPTLALHKVEPTLRTIVLPIHELQAAAVADRLDGVLFQDAHYDAQGKLRFEGLRGSEQQVPALQALVEPILLATNKAAAAAGMVPLDSLRLVPWQPLFEELRSHFAGADAPLLRQTRLDRMVFRYDEGKAKPRLWIEGVCIFQGKNPPANEHAVQWSGALKDSLQARDLDRHELAFDALLHKDNPALELQRKVIDDGMDGVVFRVIGFDGKGVLRIHAFTPKGQEENVRKLLDETAKKLPYLNPIERVSSVAPPAKALTVAYIADAEDEAFDWQKMLADLRERFASAAEPILQRTRIDRAYFSLNEADPDQPPFLNFKGVCLRTVHDDEKQVRDLLRDALGKVTIPAVKHLLKIDEIAIHDTPIYALQGEAVARRQNDPTLNLLFEKAVYGADRSLRLHVLALEPAPAEKIAELYRDEKLLPVDLWQYPAGKLKAPIVIRRDFDWLAALKDFRARFANGVDPFLQRSRFDAGYFAFSEDRKILRFHLEGVCVHPPALVAAAVRDTQWKNAVGSIIPKVIYEPTTDGMKMLTNPSILWQDDAASSESHDGIHFELARFDPRGKLALRVLLPTEAQRDAAWKLVTAKQLPVPLLPIEEKNLNFQTWDWKTVLPKAQARLAQGEFFRQRTRLDRVFFKYERERGDAFLHFDGVCLHPTEVEKAEALHAKLARSFADLLPIELEHKRTAAGIRFLPSPIYGLQTEAVARNLDGLLFANGRYDDLGKLHLAVVLGAPEQAATARKMVEEFAVAEGVIRPKDAKEQPMLDLTELPWSEILRQMQGWLSRNDDTLLRKTRLDRGFFTYPAAKTGPDLNVLLVGIYPKKDAYATRLTKRFADFAQLYLTDRLLAGPVGVVPHLEHLDNPAVIVQTKVQEVPELDGVRLDDASFDGAGKLLLHGIWIGKSQRTALEKLARATLTPGHASLLRGINFDSLRLFDSPALLHDLRVWVADQQEIDEVWLERLYFDNAGKVRVSGFSTRPQDKDKVDRKLPPRIPPFADQKLPSIEGSLTETKPGKQMVMNQPGAFVLLQEAKEDGSIKLDTLANVADYLRASVAKSPPCDGLRIDRCHYDPQGVLRIQGLADHVSQTRELQPFLEGNAVPFDAKRQLGKGWKDGRITVIALRPMMIALREALPALAEFDGVTLLRAHHDAKDRLIITVQVIGDADAKQMEPIVKRLLETHPRWRVRTEKGFALEIKDRRATDADLAKRLVTRALALLQVTIGEARVEPPYPTVGGWWSHAWPFDDRLPRVRPTDAEYDRCLEYLDAALKHDPKDVLAWYLHGYVLQAKNRSDLTLRDFRRMAALEAADRDLRNERILALELVQGKLRQSAFRIEQEAILEVSNDWTLRTLAESPLAKDETR